MTTSKDDERHVRRLLVVHLAQLFEEAGLPPVQKTTIEVAAQAYLDSLK